MEEGSMPICPSIRLSVRVASSVSTVCNVVNPDTLIQITLTSIQKVSEDIHADDHLLAV